MSHTLREPDGATLDGPQIDEPAGGAIAEPEQVYHRLRDLRGPARWFALTFVLALLFAPAYALARAAPDWAPAGDPALMGLRALDVGTDRTPLVGQPSTSHTYVESVGRVHHPGALHFYLLAAPVRMFGGFGMLLVSVLVVGSCLLISAWAVFRQLGPRSGVLAAAVLGLITFTTGAWSMIDPVSSKIAGYPLLCSAVLLWCLVCGDFRLLPLTVGVVSFTAQQHLSVDPAAVVLLIGVLVGVAVVLVRRSRWREPRLRRELGRWGAGALVVAVVMWLPVLIDQVAGDGNLGRLADYAASSDRETLGLSAGVHAVVHTLGLPPVLGTTNFSGEELVSAPSVFTWLTAAAMVGLVVFLGLRWRTTNPRRSLLPVMVAISAAAGLVTGSSVPTGFEQFRPAFYHWVFVLTFFTYLVVGLALLDLVRATLRDRRWLGPALIGAALVGIVVPSALNPWLDRESNVFGQVDGFWKRADFDQLSDAVVAHRDQLGHQTVLLRGGSVLSGYREALAFNLAEHGIAVRHPHTMEGFVHDGRLVDAATVDSALVLAADRYVARAPTPPGRLISHIDRRSRFDVAAYDRRDPELLPTLGITGFRLYVLDRKQLLQFATAQELGTTRSTRSG